MKSDVIAVSNRADKIEYVLNQTEKVAAFEELSHKSALYLRLLSEEMMSMVRSVTRDLDGEFWIENKGQDYELHLRVETDVDFSVREKLLSASTSGKNEANRGLMGKIRAFFEPTDDVPVFFAMGNESSVAGTDWSMRAYESEIQRYLQEKREGAEAAWDELEKSVISHVADEVKVSIRGPVVEMTVFKKLS